MLRYLAVAVQLYNAAQLLLLLNRPSRGGLNEYIELAKLTQKCVADICGIAMTLNDYPSSIMSSQCVYIGLFSSDIFIGCYTC